MPATVGTRAAPGGFATNFAPADGTLLPVKRVLRYVVMLPGVLYLWALLPVSFRPQYTGSPLRKPDPTVNVDVSAAKAVGVSTSAVTAAAATGLTKLSSSRIKEACEPPALLKPIVEAATGIMANRIKQTGANIRLVRRIIFLGKELVLGNRTNTRPV